MWGLIEVVEGRLIYRTIEPASEQTLDPQHRVVIRPGQVHEVEPLGAVRFFVEFYADPTTSRRPKANAERADSSAPPHG
jgi:Domain of unknown function (DUF1971)